MYELTLGGSWFRWSAFDRVDRMLAGTSMGLGTVSGLLIGMAAKPANTRFGFDVTPYASTLALCGIAAAVLAAWSWHRFSLRQDEMFNRVQHWTLGMAGAWTCAAYAAWSVLAAGSFVAPMPSVAPALLFAATTLVFWFVAVRKWAY